MVRSDVGTAGVLFTLETESGFPDVVLINPHTALVRAWSRGELIPTSSWYSSRLSSKVTAPFSNAIGSKQEKLIYATRGGHSTRIVPVPLEDRLRLSLNDDDVLTLARWGCLIEDHYSAKAKLPVPMDIEWAKDGRSGELFILQARPETIHALAGKRTSLEIYRLQEDGPMLLEGRSMGEKSAQDTRVVKTLDQLQDFKVGEVLVADMTDPDWEARHENGIRPLLPTGAGGHAMPPSSAASLACPVW